MPTDLIVLVADKNLEHGVRGLLGRPQSFGIRPVTSKIYVHPQRDPACAQKAHDFLRPFSTDYDHALVIFDHRGCGRENQAAMQVESNVRQLLFANGWGGRAQAIVIEPELENWVFSASPRVETCLGWTEAVSLRQWLLRKGLWGQMDPKPADPKAALEKVLASLRRPRSSAIYEQLAKTVSFLECQDPAFNRLRAVLQHWFPA